MSKAMNREELIKLYEEIGLNVLDNNTVMNSSNKKICNFLVNIIEQRVIDGKMYLCINAMGINGELLSEVILDSNTINRTTWVIENWGFKYSIDKKYINDFIELIQHLCMNIKTKYIYDHTGWIYQDNKWIYLHGGGVIGGSDVQVELDESIDNYILPDKISDINKACEMSLKLVDLIEDDKGIIFSSLVYLSPLIEIISRKIKPPENIVWTYGKTGSRKTAVSKVVLSHFGDFNKKIPATFNDTITAIELKANKLKDSLYLCDDFAPKQDFRDKKIQDSKAESIIRMYGDRVGKGRSSNKLDIKDAKRPRGMILITGEDVICGESSNARLLSIELNRSSVDLNILTELQNNSHLLGEAMRGYIEWLLSEMGNIDELSNILLYNFKSYRDEIREQYKDDIHGRTIESSAWILVGFSCMLNYIRDKGVIDKYEDDEYMDRAIKVVERLIEEQIKLISRNSPIDIFLNTLKESINSKSIRIATLNDQNQVIEDKLEYICGYKDKEYYYFYTDKVYSFIEFENKKRGIHLGISQRQLVKQLRDSGIVKVDSNNDSPKKTIHTKDASDSTGYTTIRPRMLQIERSIIENFQI
ncbi:hypothetical protein L9Z07_00655 [Clostridioides difficile]|nr:hypothetical protein [Clostridioides difficile]